MKSSASAADYGELMKLIKSFRYAINGMVFCVRHERNMRIHIIAMIYVAYFAQFYELSRSEIILLIIVCALVMMTEMINTAIEVVIDKVSPQYSPLAKVGKDVAAGAVFLSAVMAVVVGILLFWDLERFALIWRYFTSDWSQLVLLLGFSVIAFVFIRSGKKRNIKGKNK